jgi:putative Holliday junction resolvase
MLDSLPRGTRLGIDVGKARIGVAASDPDGLLAMPVMTVKRTQGTDVAEIAEIARTRGALVAYVGLPRHMSGREGEATRDARNFALALAKALPDVEFRFIDERLTTVSATANLQSAGIKAKNQRSVIDQQAAVIILQAALDTERARGERAGSLAKRGA